MKIALAVFSLLISASAFASPGLGIVGCSFIDVTRGEELFDCQLSAEKPSCGFKNYTVTAPADLSKISVTQSGHAKGDILPNKDGDYYEADMRMLLESGLAIECGNVAEMIDLGH